MDELMMDWLYEELDPASSSRVAEHMGICPRCSAQAGALRRTREAFRGLSDLEPPASVSAILLHEAARRAPSVAAAPVKAAPARASDGEGFGAWLRSWLRPLAMHPAATALATLVLVAGVAGALFVRHGADMAAPRPVGSSEAPPAWTGEAAADRTSPASAPTEAPAEEKAPAAAPEPSPPVDRTESAKRDPADSPADSFDDDSIAGGPDLPKAQSGDVQARLLDGKQQAQLRDAEAVEKERAGAAERQAGLERDKSARSSRSAAKNKPAFAQPPPADKAFEVGLAQAPRKGEAAQAGEEGRAAPPAQADTATRTRGGPAVGGAAGGPSRADRGVEGGVLAPAAPPPEPARPQPTADTGAAAHAETAPGTAPPGARRGASREPLSREEQGWLDSSTQKLAGLVKVRRCREAAAVANDILDRNADFYSRRIADPKVTAPCQRYVTDERRKRVVSRAKARPAAKSTPPKATASEPAADAQKR
jgi:hypothetical protein